MTRQSLMLTCLFVAVLTTYASAQQPSNPQPCHFEAMDDADGPAQCPTSNIPLPPDNFHTTPLMDGTGSAYGSTGLFVSLYGACGNDEKTSTCSAAHDHYTHGTSLVPNIQPRCRDGSIPPSGYCQLGDLTYPPAVVFLFIGLSNWEIEIGGGSSNIWTVPNHDYAGQPCSTPCENLNNPDGVPPWEFVTGEDMFTSQQSLLEQVYSPLYLQPPMAPLVGPHVVLFNGALGKQTLNKWDPTDMGFYSHNNCDLTHQGGTDPECNYHRILEDLTRNGYTEAQVQAVFLKSADSFPQCDLKHNENGNIYCATPTTVPDAYTSEQYMGNIVRYLKCCKHNTTIPRYPNLQQVFLTTRTYAGYARNTGTAGGATAGCVSPEPYSFEEGFAVQKLIMAQINGGGDDGYSGPVDYTNAPWFDWGPYLWTSGSQPRNDGFFWCGGQPGACGGLYDVRTGDLTDETYWGDYTHPSARGQQKVATQLVYFLTNQGSKLGSQVNITNWVKDWIGR